METTKKNLLKPTSEIVKEYNELDLILNSIDENSFDKKINAASARMDELMEQYDFSEVS